MQFNVKDTTLNDAAPAISLTYRETHTTPFNIPQIDQIVVTIMPTEQKPIPYTLKKWQTLVKRIIDWAFPWLRYTYDTDNRK